MAKIQKIKGRQVFDSRGNPTVEAEVFTDSGNFVSAIVPSGASTGTYEAFELRDKENKNYLGKSVFNAVENINNSIKKSLYFLSRTAGANGINQSLFFIFSKLVLIRLFKFGSIFLHFFPILFSNFGQELSDIEFFL